MFLFLNFCVNYSKDLEFKEKKAFSQVAYSVVSPVAGFADLGELVPFSSS